MKEHKKLYKAGKLWVTATLFAFAGVVLAASPAAADDTVNAAPQASAAVTTDNGQAATANTDLQSTQATSTPNYQQVVASNQLESGSTSGIFTNLAAATPYNKGLYMFTDNPNVNDYTYAGQFSLSNYDPSSFKLTLNGAKDYQPVAGDLGLFDKNGNQVSDSPSAAGAYSINLTAAGLAHINAADDEHHYDFDSRFGIDVYLKEATDLGIETAFNDSPENHVYTYNGQSVPALNPSDVTVKIMSQYSIKQIATYHPVAGDLEYVDEEGKNVDPQQVGLDGNFSNSALEKQYDIYVTEQGIENIQRQYPFIKSIYNLNNHRDELIGLSVGLAKIIVKAGQGQLSLSATPQNSCLGADDYIKLSDYTLKYVLGSNQQEISLQDGDLAFFDENGNQVTPTQPGTYYVSLTESALNRLNSQLGGNLQYHFNTKNAVKYRIWVNATAKLNGPSKIELNQGFDLSKYSVTLFYNGTPVYTYHLKAGDFKLVDQNGNDVTHPTIAGNYTLKEDRLLISLEDDPVAMYYQPENAVTKSIQLYQPYVPTAEDYKQNFGSLDGHSIRQVSDSEAALHVAGWHASGASAVMPNGWLIVFDNTLGHEIKRVQIKPVNRPDVQAAYPNVYGSLQSGFDQDILIPLANAGDDLTIIARYSSDAVSGEGQRIDHWFDRMNVDHGNHAYVDSVQFANGQLHVAGWHATNTALGKPYHSIIVWDATQGRELERVNNVTVNRPDIPGVYPTIVMADHSGFSADLKLLPEMANDQIQFISRYSTDEAGNQDYVDYWFGPQQLLADHRNQAYLDNINVQNGKLHIAGWHVTNQSIGRPYHSIIVLNANTGRELGRYTSSQPVSRPDLTRVFLGVITAAQNGFSGDIALTAGMGDQPIRIISRWSATADANSNYVDYWFAPQQLYPDLSNRAALDGFTAQGAVISAAGWHATTQSLGRGHHYIILFDQTTNREVQRREVTDNNNRPDVAQAFPGVYNADHAGFNVQFTVDFSVNGHRLVILSRWTDDPAGNGNAVDYWFGSQPVTPEAPVIPAGGVNSPDNFNVKQAFHIDGIEPVLEEDRGQGIAKGLKVTGWAISNYCANWNYKTWRDEMSSTDKNVWMNARGESITLRVNGKDLYTILPQYDGFWNNNMGLSRPDVAAKYPDVWDSLHGGFSDYLFFEDEYKMWNIYDVKPTDNCQIVVRFQAPGVDKHTEMVSPIYHFDASMWDHAKVIK